ncbi:polyprenyl synthetase family protein [Prosthecomicrobium sp. N25]|uniref:polyprenyl synthetase family protein n=1 Tax=Prosthecomicrobium sp. N25 TaxID=3129254 RepID=UPI0030776BFC
MDVKTRLERALRSALALSTEAGCPPRLAEAMRYAVFPGGHRIRPRLALAVAWACGDDDPDAADAAAASIELLHCASLVHDDMPCFDDAATRRGRPSVHRAFGEPTALLVGDGLIVLAFELLALQAAGKPRRLANLVRIVAGAVGAGGGIVGGQAWECEPFVPLGDYHRAKTGALFAGATMAGAAAAGAPADAWRSFGNLIGEAYQVADDIADFAATSEAIGKPVGRDAALGRPSAALELGLAGALARLDTLVADAAAAIPPCPGRTSLEALVVKECKSFVPAELALSAA